MKFKQANETTTATAMAERLRSELGIAASEPDEVARQAARELGIEAKGDTAALLQEVVSALGLVQA